MEFRNLATSMMDLPEIEEELAYQSKRLYRLRKLEQMGKIVQPDLGTVEKREGALDMELRLRRRGMAEIPN